MISKLETTTITLIKQRKLKMKSTIVCTITLLALVPSLFHQKAQAQPCYNYPAIAMVTDLPSIQAGAFDRKAGSVKHHGNSTHDIVLFAPVIDNSGSSVVPWDHFSMLCIDPDGAKKKTQVKATLIYAGPKGEVNIVAELDSNNQPGGSGVSEISTPLQHQFNFIKRYYFVRVTVSRQNAELAPEIFGIELCRVVR